MVFPFSMRGVISYLPIRNPTEFEYLSCEKVWLTSEMIWDPTSEEVARKEVSYNHDQGRSVKKLWVVRGVVEQDRDDPAMDLEPEIHSVARNIAKLQTRVEMEERKIATLNTDLRRLDLNPRELQERFGGVSLDVVSNTLLATTQHAFRSGQMPLTRRYKTAIQQLRYRRLKSRPRGNNYAQLFTNGKGWEFSYPMKLKSEAPYALQSAFKQFGLPEKMVTDGAPELHKSEWAKKIKDHNVGQTITEHDSPRQNRCEGGIKEHKKSTRRSMNREKTPAPLWDYCSQYTGTLRSMLALPSNPGGRPGAEAMTGETVHYWNEGKLFPEDRQEIGRWLGPAHDVGQALCYWILKDNGQIVARMTVKPIKRR